MSRLLAFSDPHGNPDSARRVVALAKRERPGLVICAGDLTVFGERYQESLEILRDLGMPIHWCWGNHESADVAREIEATVPGVLIDLTYRSVEVDGVRLAGLPGTQDIAPGTREDEGVLDLALSLWGTLDRSRGHLILVSHFPPTGCRCDGLRRDSSGRVGGLPVGDAGGSKVVRGIVERLRPDLVVCGHYHECFGAVDLVAQSRIINPGPDGTIIEV